MGVPELIDREKLRIILKNTNRPGRYIGTEVGSTRKNFNNASVKVVLAFPDLYEIGISNLGLKIIYNKINSHPDYFADRTYAPDKDFQQLMHENNIDLYGIESFIKLKSFDMIAFSLQYELNYTTMLGMLELANIPLYSKDRTDEHPLIIAGGPSCFNPEPFADFVNAVLISDGEDIIIETLNKLDELKRKNIASRKTILKELSTIQGVYVPSLYKITEECSRAFPLEDGVPTSITKRVSSLEKELHPDEFPIPFISTVHDRAVVEIRRGCARMCRFCQPCFVNLPVRERSHDDIKDLCFRSLETTGYEEISLLSLSTSDYAGLETLALELNDELVQKEISISLPSQRADNFNLELAKQLQTVRKSILTFAPEAGSERLRNVINKNLQQEDVIRATMSAYQAGWYRIKLYFIIGLPTETFEDLDAIVELIKTIKNEANKLKNTCIEIKKLLDITCTISIFVPKPFTPFQWFGQPESEEIKDRKFYLIKAAKSLKGVKLNFHDIFSSKLEALFSRGDRSLSTLILNAYNNGAYLDSWHEYFSVDIWKKSADQSSIDIEQLTTREFDTVEALPWEIINTGINKEWLIEQRNLALEEKNSIPCQDHCTNCGVCVNLNVSPQYESKKHLQGYTSKTQTEKDYSTRFKYRIKITKEGNLKYISHLDWFRMIYRTVRRAHLPVVFSQGFNPAPKMSIAMPLGLFIESISEFMDIELTEKIDEEILKARLNEVLPVNCQVLNVKTIDNKADSLSQIACWAEYEALAEPSSNQPLNFEHIETEINSLLSQDEIIISKKTKSKTRKLDARPLIKSVEIIKSKPEKILFTLNCQPESTLRPEEFLNLFSDSQKWAIKRLNLKDKFLKVL